MESEFCCFDSLETRVEKVSGLCWPWFSCLIGVSRPWKPWVSPFLSPSPSPSLSFWCLYINDSNQSFFFFFLPVPVETDLQAGANHGFEVKDRTRTQKKKKKKNHLFSCNLGWWCELVLSATMGGAHRIDFRSHNPIPRCKSRCKHRYNDPKK